VRPIAFRRDGIASGSIAPDHQRLKALFAGLTYGRPQILRKAREASGLAIVTEATEQKMSG